MTASGDLHRRGLAREGEQTVSSGVPGEINQDVDAIGTYLLSERLIGERRYLMPAIGASTKLCRQRIGLAHSGIADELKGLLVMMGEHGGEEKPDWMLVITSYSIHYTKLYEAEAKMYYRYSGYQSGMKAVSFKRLRETYPQRIIEHAVRGMLPKNTLGRAMLRKLKVYAGPDHRHQAQNPRRLEI